jgi:uncharacterized membrane protein
VAKVFILAFLASITIGSYLALRKRPAESFTSVYLLSITIKILLSCVFVIVLIVNDKPNADFNVVFFIAGYVIFTAAEVTFLLLKKRL